MLYRPTNHPTDLRVHEEVLLLVWFAIHCQIDRLSTGLPEASKGFLSYLVLTDRAYRPTWSSPGRVSCPTLSSQTGTLVLLGPHRQPVRASCPTWSSQAGLPVFPSPHRQPVRASCLNWSSQAGLPFLTGPHRQGFLLYLVLTGRASCLTWSSQAARQGFLSGPT